MATETRDQMVKKVVEEMRAELETYIEHYEDASKAELAFMEYRSKESRDKMLDAQHKARKTIALIEKLTNLLKEYDTARGGGIYITL
jgi:hypothetical protein